MVINIGKNNWKVKIMMCILHIKGFKISIYSKIKNLNPWTSKEENMKRKIVSVLLCLTMLGGMLTGCGEKQMESTKSKDEKEILNVLI